jgi:hypothetical protein
METFIGRHWNEENKQLDWVLNHFPEYGGTAFGDSRRYPSTQPILYRKSRFQALDQGFFFFSADPDQIYSRPWKGRFPAFCSWSRIREKDSGRSFYVYNVHFDYSSLRNRLYSAQLVAERIAFNRGISVQPAIDHVLFSNAFTYRSTRVIRDRIDGQWPSDHFPLLVTLSIRSGGQQ